MARFLMIPHAPATPLRTRAGELSRALASLGHEVEILTRTLQPKNLNSGQKLQWHLRQLTKGFHTEPIAPGVKALTTPTLHRWETSGLTRGFEAIVSRILFKRGYDYVISSAYGGVGSFKNRSGSRPALVYDLVDDHGAGWRHAGFPEVAQRADAFEQEQIGLADHFIASSLVLKELAQTKFGRLPEVVPNGASVAEIRKKAGDPRAHANLTIGYVGGLDGFVRIDLVIGAIERLRRNGVPAELIVVGDGQAIRKLALPPWVQLLGFRPPEEIPSLLAKFRVGVVPFELSPYTDAALPLKAIEYGAARIATVSSPLEELKRRNLPWITLAELNEEKWAQAIHLALKNPWMPDWDAEVDRFEWARSAAELIRLLGRAAPLP